MDGEEEPMPTPLVDVHLAGCQACQRWQSRAGVITRSLRVRPAVATPDLTDRILAAIPAPAPARRRHAPRWALGGVAFVQLILALAQLLGVDHTAHLAAGTGEHLFNESAAWNLGVAIGLLAAAVRPWYARGLLPALAAFVAVLVAVSAIDVLSADVGFGRVSSHAMVVVGLVLLYLVERQYRSHPVPGWAVAPPRDTAVPTSAAQAAIAEDAADRPSTSRSEPGLRAGGRHAA
jgi:predicted anti-sigma-YlaC factor YlaD